MIDVAVALRASRLRWLKWLCTLGASVAAVIATGIAINWATSVDSYHWSALPIALAVMGIFVAARNAIALKLDDRR